MIRSYQDSDYDQLKDLYSHIEWYGGVFDEARDGRERLHKKIEDDPKAILAYEAGGVIVGTISIIDDGRVAWLYRFVVKDFDKEITKALYDAATKVLRLRGHREVLIYSPAGNSELAGRYKSLGMNKGGDYTCYYDAL